MGLDNGSVIGRSAAAELEDLLRERIFDGSLPPGQRLTATQLAEDFGLSRGPVRTALARLEVVGLVEELGQRGGRVTQMTPEDIKNVYAVRLNLESLAIDEMQSLSAPQLEPIRLAMASYELARTGSSDGAVVREADLQLHRSWVVASQNSPLVAAWDLLSDRIRLAISTVNRLDVNRVSGIVKVHEDVVHAIEKSEWDEARAALARHLNSSRDALMDSMTRTRQSQ